MAEMILRLLVLENAGIQIVILMNGLTEVNNWSDNPGTAFDFPLRDKLKNLCDTYGYSLLNMITGETVSDERLLLQLRL
jgi:hypothetical protein